MQRRQLTGARRSEWPFSAPWGALGSHIRRLMDPRPLSCEPVPKTSDSHLSADVVCFPQRETLAEPFEQLASSQIVRGHNGWPGSRTFDAKS